LWTVVVRHAMSGTTVIVSMSPPKSHTTSNIGTVTFAAVS